MGMATAKLNKVRISPRKLNLIAAAIRGLRANKAIAFLTFCKKRAANDVKKTLSSAIANAENNHGLDVDTLFVKEAYVGQSIVLKRMSPRAKGRGAGIKKRFSSLSIVLEEGA